MPPAVYRDCDESSVTCMKNYERWLCHEYDVNYMIMQSNMTMMKRVIITERWKVAWQYISEWLWKCHTVAVLRKVYGGFMVPAKVARYKRG